MFCVCVSFSGWMGKTKALNAFWQSMVVGAPACVKNFNAAGFLTLNTSCVHQEWKRKSSQLNTILGSIGVTMDQHPCGRLLTHIISRHSYPEQLTVVSASIVILILHMNWTHDPGFASAMHYQLSHTGLVVPCRVHTLMNWTCSEGKSWLVQLNIRKLFLMFCILSV